MSGTESFETTHFVHVSFRFIGPQVNPGLVTSRLAITPSFAHEKGDPMPKYPGRRYSTGYWGLDSSLPETEAIEAHLSYLLDLIEPKAAAIRTLLSPGCRGDFYISYFTDSPQGSLELSPELAQRVGRLRLGITVSIYCSVDDDGGLLV